jgi:predicted nuclease of predicted toxin-antitoxin system
MNLLIDENLSPTLVQRLGAKGVAAQHVAHTGMAGHSDPAVWRYAFEHDQVIVTQNVEDFLLLAETGELHPGLIVLRSGGLTREEQWQWLEPVVNALLESGESLVNRAVEVTGVGRFSIRDLPPP